MYANKISFGSADSKLTVFVMAPSCARSGKEIRLLSYAIEPFNRKRKNPNQHISV